MKSKIDREYNQSALNEVSPLYSNSIHRALLATHINTEGPILEIAYRSGVRGFLDQRYFYDNESSVEFFNTSVFLNMEDSSFKLNQFTFIDIKSMDSLVG